MPSHIENYALIGDTQSAALVSRDGAMDWLCLPRFDSDACFAGLLGRDEHGTWVIHPSTSVRSVTRRYRNETMILETEFACDGGVVRLIDFMPIAEGVRHHVVRIVEGVEGTVPIDMILTVRFGYGATWPWIRQTDDGILLTASPDSLRLRTPAKVEVNSKRVSCRLEVSRGQRVPFELEWHPSHTPPIAPLDVNAVLAVTERFWTEWAGRCRYRGPHREAVVRSLLTLKALTYATTGGIVAAPTTSLPEEIGGVRNWDYRYCWLRDSALTLDALMLCGYPDEALAFRAWLLRTAAGDPSKLQIMYGIDGKRRLTEFDLDWLPGYAESRPVRVGNGAWNQFQIDVYGEVFDTMYKAHLLGATDEPEAWRMLMQLLEFLERAWQRPDEGIWEVRGAGHRHFVHSKIMAWVAFDRAIRMTVEFGLGGSESAAEVPHWRAVRDRIHRDVCENGYDPAQNAFTQSYGSTALDASVLLIPTHGFLPADDPRVLGTIRGIERKLLREGFVRRYATEKALDGLPGDEAPFLACSFWLADAYAATGRIRDAEAMFERLLAIRNEVGLLAEEYDPGHGRLLGNFPQGFSHLALIHTATVLAATQTQVVGGDGARAAAARAGGAMNPWIDVTVPIRQGMVHWPGNPGVRIETTEERGEGGVCRVSALALGVHTGTHVDAPVHFDVPGGGVEALAPSDLVGPARVVAVGKPVIDLAEVEAVDPKEGERLLFKTRNSERCWETDEFVPDYVYLAQPAALLLAARRVALVGVDYLSIGGPGDGAATHRALLSARVCIVEGLDLRPVRPGMYELVALPILIPGADGAPARVLLRAQ